MGASVDDAGFVDEMAMGAGVGVEAGEGGADDGSGDEAISISGGMGLEDMTGDEVDCAGAGTSVAVAWSGPWATSNERKKQ